MIYHLSSREEWAAAQADGEYRAESLDSEGFIHCSTREQVLAVADAFYGGRGELLLLCIEEARLTAPLLWEAPAPPENAPAPGDFPHIYGALNLDAVVDARILREGSDGYDWG